MINLVCTPTAKIFVIQYLFSTVVIKLKFLNTVPIRINNFNNFYKEINYFHMEKT